MYPDEDFVSMQSKNVHACTVCVCVGVHGACARARAPLIMLKYSRAYVCINDSHKGYSN